MQSYTNKMITYTAKGDPDVRRKLKARKEQQAKKGKDKEMDK